MAEVLKAPARWWNAIPNTGPNIHPHPNATLDAQAARLTSAYNAVLNLDLGIKRTDSEFQKTLSDIERHYTEQVDGIEKQYNKRSGELWQQYAVAHEALLREQKAFQEMAKTVHFKGEFVNHFPEPKPLDVGGPES